jgi:hypothetical protein
MSLRDRISDIVGRAKEQISSYSSQLVGLPSFPAAVDGTNTQDFMVYCVIEVLSEGYLPEGSDIGRGDSFVLPPPLQILDLDSADWQATDYYVYAEAMKEAFATGQGKDVGTALLAFGGKVSEQALSGVFDANIVTNLAATQAKAGTNLYTAASIIKQSAFNPNVELLYKAPKLRQIQLQWKLSPLNERDSTNIYNFIRKMKLYMYPVAAQDTGWMGYPARFAVQIKTSENTLAAGSSSWAGAVLFSMGKSRGSIRGDIEIGCVLTDLQVEFGEGGMYAGHKDHSPSTISITASFTESTLLTRDKVEAEYGLRNI